MHGWNGNMDGWHLSSGWMPVSLVVVAGLTAVVVWALFRARRRR